MVRIRFRFRDLMDTLFYFASFPCSVLIAPVAFLQFIFQHATVNFKFRGARVGDMVRTTMLPADEFMILSRKYRMPAWNVPSWVPLPFAPAVFDMARIKNGTVITMMFNVTPSALINYTPYMRYGVLIERTCWGDVVTRLLKCSEDAYIIDYDQFRHQSVATLAFVVRKRFDIPAR